MSVKALNIRILQRFNHEIYSSFFKTSGTNPPPQKKIKQLVFLVFFCKKKLHTYIQITDLVIPLVFSDDMITTGIPWNAEDSCKQTKNGVCKLQKLPSALRTKEVDLVLVPSTF